MWALHYPLRRRRQMSMRDRGSTWPLLGSTEPLLGSTWPLLGSTWPLLGSTWRLSGSTWSVSYTHVRAHDTKANFVCRLLPEKKLYISFH